MPTASTTNLSVLTVRLSTSVAPAVKVPFTVVFSRVVSPVTVKPPLRLAAPLAVKVPPTTVLPVVLIVLAVTESKVKLVPVNAVAISAPAMVKVPVTLCFSVEPNTTSLATIPCPSSVTDKFSAITGLA